MVPRWFFPGRNWGTSHDSESSYWYLHGIFLKKKKIFFLIFTLGGAVVGLAGNGLSLVVVSGATLQWQCMASHCSGFPRFGAQALEHMSFNSCNTKAQ